ALVIFLLPVELTVAAIIGIALTVVGLVFLVVGLISSLIERFRQAIAFMHGRHWAWWFLVGPWTVLVSVGDVFGVSQILEGILGHNLINWDEIDPEERAALITQGVLTLLTIGLFRAL